MKIIVSFIVFMLLLINSCHSTSGQKLFEKYKANKNLYFFQINSGKYKIIIVKKEKEIYGEIDIIALSEKDKYLNHLTGYVNRNHLPYFITDDYFVVMSGTNRNDMLNLFVYIQNENRFINFKIDTGMPHEIIIFKNKLYYNLEKSIKGLIEINIRTGECTKFLFHSYAPGFFYRNDSLFVSNKQDVYAIKDKKIEIVSIEQESLYNISTNKINFFQEIKKETILDMLK